MNICFHAVHPASSFPNNLSTQLKEMVMWLGGYPMSFYYLKTQGDDWGGWQLYEMKECPSTDPSWTPDC